MTRRYLPVTALALAAYIGSILLANWLTSNYGQVPVWWGMKVTAGTYAAGFALLARDAVQRTAGIKVTLVAMLIGVVLSWLLADPRVALASAVAFGAAELVDLLIYTPVEARGGWGRAVLASNVVSTPIDTVVFLAIAGFPVTWASVSGQFVGKLLWATLLPLTVYAAVRWLLARQRRTQAA
jgi:uncharacterized PurR-regulated membrane protein YhhQ (DUF165 family)